ncbi:MAG: efflux RND transporter periplasmic adaptor subunit [Thermoanaerobaculia bacterium]|jgi:membrane fusion protein (multidrug efflux system)
MKHCKPSLPFTSLVAFAAAFVVTACSRTDARPPNAPVEVRTVTVSTERVELTNELPGRTSASAIAEIRPQVNGLVLSRNFTEGSEVREGSTLYQIDPAPYRAAWAQAAAAVATAEANVPALRSRASRLAELALIDAASKQDADDANAALLRGEASVAAANAALESAQINLAYTPLRAPISGRVGRSNVTIGAMVTAYQPMPLAVIQKLDPIYVDVTQSSSDLLKLRRALESGAVKADAGRTARVKILLEDGTSYPLEGTFQFRDVTVDPTTGSVMLRMVFPNPRNELLPGMFVRAFITEGIEDASILVPQQGVTRNPRGQAVAWIVGSGDKAEQRVLTVGRAIGDKWVVVDGLAAGDRVIVEGLQRLRPGVVVHAAEFVTPAKPQRAEGAR